MNLARSIVAIACGYVVALSIMLFGALVVGLVMFHGKPVPAAPPEYVASNASIAFAGSILAGALTGRIALRRPLYHALALAVTLLSIGIFALVFRGPQSLVPTWYEPVLAFLAAAGAVTGGTLVKSA